MRSRADSGLEASLEDDCRDRLVAVEDFELIDSTNTYLLRQTPPPPGFARLAVADHQTAGRGRRDRVWHTEPGSALCLSLAYTFRSLPANLPAATLVMGVSVGRALAGFGVAGIQLKWPNDIVVDGGKLGGLLAETLSKADVVTVVAGVGINLSLPQDLKNDATSGWAQEATDLASCLDETPQRDALASAVSAELLRGIRQFESDGIGAFLEDWRRLDWLRGRHVTVEQDAESTQGVAAGVADDGALLLQTDAQTLRILGGSITLARQAGA